MVRNKSTLAAALSTHAEFLNSIAQPRWFARPFYDFLSGGLIWTDEIDVSTDVINVLRPLFNHRSVVILAETDETWLEYWHTAHELFPKWIGFRRPRCTPSAKLRALIKRGRRKMEQEARELGLIDLDGP